MKQHIKQKDELIPLKYCVRTKHSKDMPLKYPRKNCEFKGSTWKKRDPHGIHDEKECEWYPAHLRYCEANGIKVIDNLKIKFRCVLHE